MQYRLFLGFLLLSSISHGQILKPGFEKAEYIETLKINQKVHFDLEKWNSDTAVAMPEEYVFLERSPVVAFDNLFDLWRHKTKAIALVSVRGSIATEASFLANLYAAMIPASGTLELSPGEIFEYQLSENPRSAVHAGWCIAMAHIAGQVRSKIDSLYQTGIKDIILTGHSQGGGITFLLSSYLDDLKRQGVLPQDLRFKTYCSAGPKPGNLYFSHDYQHRNAEGWAYNVINTADWVPDVPFTVQTVEDFTSVNPFTGAEEMIKKQKFPKNVALRHFYNKLSRPSRKAQKNYEKYLGKMVSLAVKKQIPDMTIPRYYKSNYYVPTGETIILYPDDDYFSLWNNDPANPNIWQHHFLVQYLYLAEKL